MDEGDTKTCENCKREIPAVNFTIHAVHCARNIGVCPVCKEPVQLAQLQQHHDAMHKLSPCQQCGEGVCGTDLEDHVRDSCAHTMKTCRFCALELRRGELPPHERYCGARTERCADCGEWVMHKYRALHLDSNHGFVRLHDDPEPNEGFIKKTNVPKSSSSNKSSVQPNDRFPNSNNINRPLEGVRIPPASEAHNGIDSENSGTSSKLQNTFSDAPTASKSHRNEPASIPCTSKPQNVSSGPPGANSATNRQVNGSMEDRITNAGEPAPRAKRSNHLPQLNARAAPPDKLHKELWASRGAVKKRPAPAPPAAAPPPAPPPDPARDLLLLGAERRRQREDERRRQQTACNLSVGLPPVLSAAAKLDKLRNMDALQRGAERRDRPRAPPPRDWHPGHVLGAADAGGPTEVAAERLGLGLRDLKPMSAEQFARRYADLRLRREPPAAPPAAPPAPADRFSQIKSSLRELRRDLNEVTAPYNLGAAGDCAPHIAPHIAPHDAPHSAPHSAGDSAHSGGGAVRLPCEFCGAPVAPDDLVQHQTGCRPDLTQYRPASRSRSRDAPSPESRGSSRGSSRAASPVPVIPCEFCTEALPLYLINEHQERCGRDANLLFPD